MAYYAINCISSYFLIKTPTGMKQNIPTSHSHHPIVIVGNVLLFFYYYLYSLWPPLLPAGSTTPPLPSCWLISLLPPDTEAEVGSSSGIRSTISGTLVASSAAAQFVILSVDGWMDCRSSSSSVVLVLSLSLSVTVALESLCRCSLVSSGVVADPSPCLSDDDVPTDGHAQEISS